MAGGNPVSFLQARQKNLPTENEKQKEEPVRSKKWSLSTWQIIVTVFKK